jgi:sugar phosphate isomerase/epimerase
MPGNHVNVLLFEVKWMDHPVRNIINRLYVSTIAKDAAETAEAYHLGLELTEFCTAANMDECFNVWDEKAREKMKSGGRYILHAPFNELFPAAIDPLVLNITKKRYKQAFDLARSYHIDRMVAHSGYVPFVYFKEYFVWRSVEFWKEYLSDKPAGFHILLENVLEDSPDELISIVRGVNDPRFRLCLDMGHANIARQGITIEDWTKASIPYLGHVHVHNNNGWPDSHGAPDNGEMDMEALLRLIINGAPEATLTLEIRDTCRSSVEWMISKGFTEK